MQGTATVKWSRTVGSGILGRGKQPGYAEVSAMSRLHLTALAGLAFSLVFLAESPPAKAGGQVPGKPAGEPGPIKLLVEIEGGRSDDFPSSVFPFSAITPDGKNLVYCEARYLKVDGGKPRCDLV